MTPLSSGFWSCGEHPSCGPCLRPLPSRAPNNHSNMQDAGICCITTMASRTQYCCLAGCLGAVRLHAGRQKSTAINVAGAAWCKQLPQDVGVVRALPQTAAPRLLSSLLSTPKSSQFCEALRRRNVHLGVMCTATSAECVNKTSRVPCAVSLYASQDYYLTLDFGGLCIAHAAPGLGLSEAQCI